MTIKIEMTVEVDAEQWANEYQIYEKDVREDVKGYIISWAEQTPIQMKVISSNQKAAA